MYYIMLPLFIVSALVCISFTIRIAYILQDDKRRRAALKKQKAKRGQSGYNTARRLYTKKYLYFYICISLFFTLSAAKELIEFIMRRETSFTFLIGAAALAIGLLGSIIIFYVRDSTTHGEDA